MNYWTTANFQTLKFRHDEATLRLLADGLLSTGAADEVILKTLRKVGYPDTLVDTMIATIRQAREAENAATLTNDRRAMNLDDKQTGR